MTYAQNKRLEVSSTSADEYSRYGYPFVVKKEHVDPVDVCLPGALTNAPTNAELGMCPKYMSQRCAMAWDDKCDMYVNAFETRKQLMDFVNETASKKYCQLSKDSQCGVLCEDFDPISDMSPKVCSYYGQEVALDASQQVDIGWYNNIVVSPYHFSKCRQTCNLVMPENVKEDDVVVRNCLAEGTCTDVLNNMCDIAIKTNKRFANSLLNEYCRVAAPNANGLFDSAPAGGDGGAQPPAQQQPTKVAGPGKTDTFVARMMRSSYFLYFLVVLIVGLILFSQQSDRVAQSPSATVAIFVVLVVLVYALYTSYMRKTDAGAPKPMLAARAYKRTEADYGGKAKHA